MLLLEYYKTASDIVKFKDKWNEQTTYLDKVKVSIYIFFFEYSLNVFGDLDEIFGCVMQLMWI